MTRTRVWLVGTVLTLTACGADDTNSVVARPAASRTPATASLTITVDAGDETEPQVWTLTCDPPGGTHPQPGAACEALAGMDADVLAPVGADQACTQIYGGPETATVRGVWEGTELDATFSRQNGCEITRWDAIAGVLATGTPSIGS